MWKSNSYAALSTTFVSAHTPVLGPVDLNFKSPIAIATKYVAQATGWVKANVCMFLLSSATGVDGLPLPLADIIAVNSFGTVILASYVHLAPHVSWHGIIDLA